MISNNALGRIRKAIHEQKFDKPPKLRLSDVESLLDAYDQLVLQASAGLVGMQVTWRDPEGDPPDSYVPVLVKLQDGYVRLARKGVNYWAYAEFTHDSYTRNKYPPISQPSNPVVGWLPILPEEGAQHV